MEKIDIISSCLVQMANNGNNNNISMSRMDLTPWDLQFLLLDPIQKGILFHKPESQQLRNTIIDHLKNTLSLTLSFFPPLAGRLGTAAVVGNDDNNVSYFVDCNNAGAEFRHAVAAEVCVFDISEANYIPEIVSSFFPLNGVSNIDGFSKPLFGVQVTELVDGIFISCTANHAVIDGTAFWHFFNSWSEISRGFDKISKMPLFEKWFPSNCNDGLILLPPLEQNNLLPKSHVMVPQLLQRVFHFSKESVAKLKAKANSEAGSDKIISSLQVVSAHLWRSIARNKSHNRQSPQINTQEEEVCCIMLFVVGARARIPLGDGYFGNGTYIAKTSISETELLGKGLGYVGLKINEFVASQNREEVVKFVEDWIEKPTIVRKGSIGNCTLAITSSPRHNVYGNDFGWGKPITVRSGKSQKFDGKMTTFPAAEDGGIDVEVCLAAETMHAMESDAEFLDAFENY